MNVRKTVDTRETTHGDYRVTARISQQIKAYFHAQPGWVKLSATQRESMDMFATKLARILSGNPTEADHWHDVAGYAKLAEDHI